MSGAIRKGQSIVTGRAPGRPRKNEPPRVPYQELEQILVFGEVVENKDGLGHTTVYPSYRDLALRYGVSNSLIAEFSKKHNCLERRKTAKMRIAVRADEKRIEQKAKSLALTRDDEIRIIDTYLAGFENALVEGSVRFDDPAHFERFCRLKRFLQGDADSRQEVSTTITLKDLQARHHEMLVRWRSLSARERMAVGQGAVPPTQLPPPQPPNPRSETDEAKMNGQNSVQVGQAEAPIVAGSSFRCEAGDDSASNGSSGRFLEPDAASDAAPEPPVEGPPVSDEELQ